MLVAGSLAALAPRSAQEGHGAERPLPTLAEARARIQALVQGSANDLAPFQPRVRAGADPWNTPRALALVEVTSPWGADDALWVQVPEHAWIQRPGENAATLVFSGRPSEVASSHGWSMPHRPLTPPEWRGRADGGLELDSALEGGLTIHFRVLPGDRLFEVRFGLTNGTNETLESAWAQVCSGFERMGALRDQSPETVRVLSAGRWLGWEAAGDLDWIDAHRDPLTCRLEKSCFFRAWVGEVEPAPPKVAENVMRLERPLDLALIVKSAADDRRHVAFYSPHAPEVLYNAFTPCGHADPAFAGLAPGETRWGVVYGLFLGGALESALAGLVELDRELATRAGFRE
jgi:hypothetical protein